MGITPFLKEKFFIEKYRSEFNITHSRVLPAKSTINNHLNSKNMTEETVKLIVRAGVFFV
jgi:hypothetical protein